MSFDENDIKGLDFFYCKTNIIYLNTLNKKKLILNSTSVLHTYIIHKEAFEDIFFKGFFILKMKLRI